MMRAIPLAVAGLALGLSAMAAARPLTFDFPPENTPPALSGEAAEVVVTHCSGCHSLDYIATQPRRKGAQFWKDEVNKMITVYKAPIDPADAEAVSRVLAESFG